MRKILTLAMILGAANLGIGCTTHTHEREAPPTIIHQDVAPSSPSAAREGARQGAREGVRDSTVY
jgi:hypothetical protein